MKVRQKAKQLAKTMGLLMMSAMTVSSLCIIPAQADTVTYSDVTPSYWAYNAIMDLSSKGIAHGSNGAFNPEAYVTRAEFATFLVNSLHLSLSSATTSDFSDVPTNSWYFPYVNTAYRANIVHGVGTEQFAPNDPISREDMMVMLANALHLQNLPSTLVNAMLPFTDATSIKSYAQSAVALGKELQLVSGNPQGDFQPLANTKRAEVAVVLDHMITLPQDRLQAMQASTFQPTTHLQVTVQPNVVAGQQASVQISLVDGNNQPATLSTPVPITLSVSNYQVGTVADQSLTIPAGGTVTTTFLAGMQLGNDVISAIPATSSLATTLSGSAKVNVYSQNASQLVSGKGMWLMWSDWHNNNSDQLIAKAKANGMSHLYIEVATSWHGEDFYGNDALDDLLPKAHAAGLKVIGWAYASLANPLHDAQVDAQVAQYRTPSGDQVDGLAPDIEETANVTQASVTTYSSFLRNTLGLSYPLILCTYPPSWRASFPWATFGQYYDVIAPMDYWHDYEHAYTYNDAYSEITSTIQKIRQVTGKPNIPITVIGEGYDMFNDNGANAPTADEIRGSMDAAKKNGAIGYSMYRWGTLNTAEWQAFGSYSW